MSAVDHPDIDEAVRDAAIEMIEDGYPSDVIATTLDIDKATILSLVPIKQTKRVTCIQTDDYGHVISRGQ